MVKNTNIIIQPKGTTTTNNNNAITNTNTVGSTLNPAGENSSGSNDSQAVETNSDLATFREALIMHSKYFSMPNIILNLK